MGEDHSIIKKSDGTMSLGDHLEELRFRLIRGLTGLLIGTFLCLFVGKYIIHLIEHPYTKVMSEYRLRHAPDPNDPNALTFNNALCTNLITALATDPNAPNLDPNIVRFVQQVQAQTETQWLQETKKGKHKHALSPLGGGVNQLTTLAPADAFMSFIKISLISGLILASPWVFYQIWMFVAVGLYENERHAVKVAVPFSTLLFITGAVFFLWVIAPLSLKFFLAFGDMIGVSCNWTFQKYISFVTMLMLVFGIAFQTPIAILILIKTGLVSIEKLKTARPYVVLGIVIVAAMATPPDVISQLSLAIPLYMLFELGILLSQFVQKKTTDQA